MSKQNVLVVRHSKLIHFSLTLILSVLFSVGCEESNIMPVPYVPMDLRINIDRDAEFIDLQTPSISMKLTRHPEGRSTIGYDNNGLIIYHYEFRKTFYAFDATCPHDLPESVSLVLDGSSAICPKCESVFVLASEGQPAAGSVSRYFLKKYRSTFYSSGVLHVYN